MFKIEIDQEVHLELIHPTHAEDTFEIVTRNRELFGRWLEWVEATKSVEDTKSFIDYALKKYAEHKEINCMIFYSDRLVGNIGLLGIKKRYGVKVGVLGYWLDEKAHRKGIMQRAVKKMVEVGFTIYNLEKITLKCAIENSRSCNVAKSLGFTHEGRHRADIRVGGVLMDVDSYAIFKEDWIDDEL